MNYLGPEVERLVDQALAEDQVFNDPTTSTLIPPQLNGTAVIKSKAHGVLAGVDVALFVFRRIDPRLGGVSLKDDSTSIAPNDVVARVKGCVASILRGERTALNFLQRMSGIATETSYYVRALEGLKAKILDTRKTVPGWRYLDKYAVRMGGGDNHRMNLADGVLIKDNHIATLRSQGLSLEDAVRQANQRAPHTVKVEVEVTNLEDVEEALSGGAHIIMLDNMSLEEMHLASDMVNGRAVIEASGGITLETVRTVAETGVDLISIGSLTHSTQALDMSLDMEL